MSRTSLRVVVVGSGAVAAQLACEYALAGYEAVLCDPEADADPVLACERVAAAFELAEQAGVCSAAAAEHALARLRHATDVAQASAACDAVVEAVADDLALKAGVLRQAADAAPAALLVTSTSLLRVTDVAREAGAPERMVGMRFGSPPLLMGFVELVAGEDSAARRVAEARDLVVAVGKDPIVLARDVEGSVWSRLQLAMVRECAHLVDEGVISQEGVDEVVREGLARRWRHVGPLRALVLGGLDTWNALARNIAPELSNADELPDRYTTCYLTSSTADLVPRANSGGNVV